MKVTKVNSTRVAVTSEQMEKNGRVVIYATTRNMNLKSTDVENVVKRRVEHANRLYGVFFKGDKKKTKLPGELEERFTNLMESMELHFRDDVLKAYKSGNKSKISKCINQQIEWLMNVCRIEKMAWDKEQRRYVVRFSNEFAKLKCNVNDEVLDDAIVRMRKPLKRGTNERIVKRLLKALAQGEQNIYANAIEDLMKNDGEALRKYIDTVNKDYYKINLLRSLAKHDVKVQITNDDAVLNLASVGNSKGNKQALTKILEKYASSPDAATETLLDIKKVLFAYFFDFVDIAYGGFFDKENLWKVPKEDLAVDLVFSGYFDDGFHTTDEYVNDEEMVATTCLDELFREDRLNWKNIKKRVNFVNYGKYLSLLGETDEGDEITRFWLCYIKEYIEKNYVTKKRMTIEPFLKISMFKECWKDIVRYLCGKYIDLGKAVYHFAMPEEMSCKTAKGNSYGVVQPEYRQGISSFAYEAIKAEETLQRNIANTAVAAIATFSRSVLQYEKVSDETAHNEDILFIKDEKLKTIFKDDAFTSVLRYYGGKSAVEVFDLKQDELLLEIKQQLNLVRNESFHYTPGKIKDISVKNTLKLWENDIKIYALVIRQKYYSNNTAMFYSEKNILNLFTDLYAKKKEVVTQIPAFRSIWKRKELPDFIKCIEKERTMIWAKDSNIRTKYEGALYFLLKEIYYNDFVQNGNKALELFVKAVNNYRGTEGVDKSKEAAENFKTYVIDLQNQRLSFAEVCQAINQEYNQQNTKTQKRDEKQSKGEQKDAYAHFRMLLPMCLKNAFMAYLKEKYSFLYEPTYNENIKGEPDYLDHVPVDCGIKIDEKNDTDGAKRRIAWYTFAHFIHPRQLNLLVGDFKSYIQYREDVLRRAGYAKQTVSAKERNSVAEGIKRAKDILEVLEFVRVIAGRVSNNFEDYYESPDEYAKYLSNYVDFAKEDGVLFEQLKKFCKNTLGNGQVMDLYADEINPKVLRNVEIARMYAGGDVILPGFNRIKEDEIKQYYMNKELVAQLLSKGLCETPKEQAKVVEQQQLKGRLTLNDVTEAFSLVNDMLGQLVSLSYLRERDEMYLLLGYYYMALRSADNWCDENLDTLDADACKVISGKILYQVVGMFDYGTPFLYKSTSENKWVEKKGWDMGSKEKRFYEEHKNSMTCAMMLFEKDTYATSISSLRNYVDHFKYYANFNKSIVELYAEFYTNFFGYSNKLRKSVLVNFKNVLEKYFMENEVQFKKTAEGQQINLIDGLFSQKFTYKLKNKEEDKHSPRNNNWKNNRNRQNQKKFVLNNVCEKEARSQEFVNGIRQILIYKK